MTAVPFPPTPINVAIERANGGPVPPLVSGAETYVACSHEGVPRDARAHIQRRVQLTLVPPGDDPSSAMSQPRPAHPYDQDARRDDETRAVQASAWAWTLLLREMERSTYQIVRDLAVDFTNQLKGTT